MKRTATFCLVLSALLLQAPAAAPAEDADAGLLWECLPAETLVAMRMPDSGGLLDALRERTKLGKVMLSEQRWDQMIEKLKQIDPAQWNEMEEELTKRGLSLDDLPMLLKGESAAAIVGEKREGREPLFVMLAWVTPGEDLATRLLEVVDRAIEEQEDEELPVTRTDRELAGHDVMHLVIPHVTQPWEQPNYRWEQGPDGQPIMVPDEDDGEGPGPRMTDQIHLLIAHVGDKLAVAMTFPQSSDKASVLLDNEEEVDFDELTGIEQAAGVFARFLAARDDEAGRDGGFAQRTMATPGLAAAMPAGQGLVEVFADLQVLFELMDGDEDMQEVVDALDGLGLSQFGVLAYRMSLDANTWRAGMFLEAPAPRQGLAAMLDQEAIAPEPPAWVPSDVVSYAHISADLGGVYELVKATVIEAFGDEAGMTFQMVEMQAMGMLQTDPASLLRSLGSQHVVIAFLPTSRQIGPDDIEMPVDRTAIVWQVQNEGKWKQIMQIVGAMPMMQGAFEPAEEQGFTGWRIYEEPMELGLMLGKGHLVLGIGPDVIEPVLAALSNPPKGEAAFRNGAVMARARHLQDFGPSIVFQAVDANRYFKKFASLMTTVFEAGMLETAGDAEAEQAVEAMKSFIPTEEELEGAFGVSAGDLIVNEHGVVSISFLELPPPD